MTANYYFAIVGHADNPLFEIEFNNTGKDAKVSSVFFFEEVVRERYLFLFDLSSIRKSICSAQLRSFLPEGRSFALEPIYRSRGSRSRR